MENKKQIIIAPSYLEGFSCIGGVCEDTCCAGWYIAIDEETYKKYRKVKEPKMKARLDKELVQRKGEALKEHVAKIKLKNSRCAFLNKENWCDIYSELGEGYLSHTCTLYPRTINKINDRLEYSLTFSCPEAARKILLKPEGITFNDLDKPWQVQTISADLKLSSKGERWQDYLLDLRAWMIQLLQDRSYPLETRLQILEEEITRINLIACSGQVKKVKEVLDKVQVERKTLSTGLKFQEDRKISREAIALAKYLENLRKEKKLKSSRYTECLEEMLAGLGFDKDGNVVLEAGQMNYLKGYEKMYKPFLEERGYILENYLVNYIFERCIPLDGATLLESYERMRVYYKLLRTHLVGIGIYAGKLEDEKVIKLIQSFSKVFDHNEECINGVLEFMRYI